MTKQASKIASIVAATVLAFLIWAFIFTCTANAQTKRDCVVYNITREIGVREATGNNDGIQVEKYLISTNLGPGYAWCAAFVNWNLSQCGAPHNNSAWSPDWFPEHRIVVNTGKGFGDSGASPLPGDVFGIYFASKKRIAHVGFILKWDDNKAVTVEGNTNDAGSREGDGVYKKVRLTKQISKVSNWIEDL